jgi:3-isopropylmalate dehydrogenase
MMFKYSLQQPELAKKIDDAVRNVIEKGVKTVDIKGTASTSEVGDAVAQELAAVLK